MSDQLSMFSLKTCADTGNAISSPELASGVTPSASPDGRMIDPSGPRPARASRSPRRESARGQRIIATFGPSCFDSSRDAALSLRLANRLQAKTALLGSTLFELTWTNAVTPAGAWCPRLAATARPIVVSGFTGVPWPTPQSQDHKQNGERKSSAAFMLIQAALLAAWNTPRATDGSHGGPNQAGGALPADVALMGWPTNQARDHFPAHSAEYIAAKKEQGHGMANFNDSAQLAAHGPERIGFSLGRNGWEIRSASGPLDPAHSRWLMALPPEWCACAVTAMQSLPRRRKRS